MAPFVKRSAADLLKRGGFVTSRGGLVLFERRLQKTNSQRNSCVYDPMTDERVFLPALPDIGENTAVTTVFSYVLLTATPPPPTSWLMHWTATATMRSLVNGAIHWLMHASDRFIAEEVREYILTCDVSTGMAGSI